MLLYKRAVFIAINRDMTLHEHSRQ